MDEWVRVDICYWKEEKRQPRRNSPVYIPLPDQEILRIIPSLAKRSRRGHKLGGLLPSYNYVWLMARPLT